MKFRKLIIFLIIVLISYVALSFVQQLGYVKLPFSSINKVLTFFNQKSNEELIVPKLSNASNRKEFFVDHWKSESGYFMLVANDIPSKIAPDKTVKEFKTLYKTQRVQVLYENNTTINDNGEERRWVFVASETGNTHLGWIFKDQLINEQNFSPLNAMDLTDFTFSRGQLTAKISLKKWEI